MAVSSKVARAQDLGAQGPPRRVQQQAGVSPVGPRTMVARWASGGGALAGVIMLLAAPISDVVAVASVTAGAHGPWSAGAGGAAKGAGRGAMRLRGGFVRTLAPSVQAPEVPHGESQTFWEEEEEDYEKAQENMLATRPVIGSAPVETAAETNASPTAGQGLDEYNAALAKMAGESASLGGWDRVEDRGGEVAGHNEVAEASEEADTEEQEWWTIPLAQYRKAQHVLENKAHPLQRASVNADTFDKQACGRNMLIGSMGKIPFPFRSIPLPLPSPLRLSLPMSIPLPFAREHTRVRLKTDGGTWLNHAVRSPVAPTPQAFSPRRLDPIEAQQRRPFTVIPLDVTGPMNQPHPACHPVKESDVSGGMAYSRGHMRPNGPGSLSYMEVRAGGPSRHSSVGIVDAEATFDDEGGTRQADFAGSPRGDCVAAFSSGAFLWALEGDEKVNSEDEKVNPASELDEKVKSFLKDEKVKSSHPMRSPSGTAKARSFRAGDRIGILVDLDEGRMAVLKNGKVVLARKGIPKDRTYRFFVGCHEPGASWSMIKQHSAHKSLKNVDWLKFYSF